MEMEKVLAEIRGALNEQKTLLLAKVDENIVSLRAQYEALDTRLKEMEKISRPRRVDLPGLEDEKTAFSFFKAIRAIKSGNWDDAGFEKEVFDNTRKKAMAALSGTGTYIVPTIYIAELIELFRAESVLIRSGATVLSDLQGSPVNIPKQTAASTAYWVGENQAITESELTLGQISLTPKKVGALVKLSNTLLRLSNPSAEALVRRDIALSLALKIDLAGLRGTGGANQPTGVAQIGGSLNTVTIGTNGGDLTFDHLIDMEYELASDNALRGNLGFVFHPAIRRKLLKLKVAQYSGDTAGAYIISPISERVLQDWLGYKYAMTTQVPINLTKNEGTALTEVYFGNWAELIIGQWGGMEIMASQETSDAFEKDQTWIRILQEVDVGVRHDQSFCLISDAKAT